MAIKIAPEDFLAQNILKSTKLVRSLIQASSIGPDDTVLEIGAGRGVITAELARIARKVIAVEIDPALVWGLRQRFQDTGNVCIVAGDYLRYACPEKDYKLFGNIPFNRSADILRRILYKSPTPMEAFLVLQREAAEKFAGCPRETQFSILAKPRFDLQIVRHLRRTDFEPQPGVDCVLLSIKKCCPPLIMDEEIDSYHRFIRFGFGTWRRSLKCIFKPVFTYRQWKRLSCDLGFALNATPTDLSFEQWLGLFNFYRTRVREERKRIVLHG